MIIILLIGSLVIALSVSGGFTYLVGKSLKGVLTQIVGEESVKHWHRFALFTIYASGLARGIDTHRLRYELQKPNSPGNSIAMTIEKWILELYRVAEDSLAGVMIASFAIFGLSLIAYVIVKGFQSRQGKT